MKIYLWARNKFSGLKSHLCEEKDQKSIGLFKAQRCPTKLTLLDQAAKTVDAGSRPNTRRPATSSLSGKLTTNHTRMPAVRPRGRWCFPGSH